MTNEKRPGEIKEVFVEFGGDPSNDKEIYKRYSSTKPFNPAGLNCEVIRFINPSREEEIARIANEIAHASVDLIENNEKLRTEVEELKIKLGKAQEHVGDANFDWAKKCSAIQSRLETAVEALKFYSFNENGQDSGGYCEKIDEDLGEVADTALEKIKE